LDGLAAFFLAAVSLAFAPVQEPAAWKATWKDLARLSESAPGSPERDRLWRALDGLQIDRERAARKAHDRTEVVRARVLRFHLSRLVGAAPRPLAEPGSNIEFMAGEAWLALQALGPGPTRARATRAALAETPADRARSDRARQVAEEDARDLHLDWAVDEARSLREHARNPRSAILLARVLRLRGEHDAAAQVVDEALATATLRADRADLLCERSSVHAAAGADALAISDLGAALASGSIEAGVRLAARALSDGEPSRARALFRSSLDASANRPAACRGGGLALLARNSAHPLALDQDPRRNPPNRPH
jgi:hypothetical protein